MERAVSRIASICIICTLSACAEWSSIQYEFAADQHKVAIIDAKQRVVSISPPTASRRMAVCVEQSPDAFSFLSGSLGLSAEAKHAAASLAMAVAESGGSMAFRTQVTQAQSNLLNALCQMNASGALSDQALRTELRRFQHTLLGIMVVEQLTASYRPTLTHQILTTTTATVGKEVEAARADLEEANKNVLAKRKELEVADRGVESSKPEEGNPGSPEHAEALKVQATKREELVAAEQALKSAEARLSAARAAMSVASGAAPNAVINVNLTSPGQPSDQVAGQVVRALEIVLHRGAVIDACSEAFFERSDQPGPSETLFTHACKDAFDSYRKAYVERERALTDAVDLPSRLLREAASLYNDEKMGAPDYVALIKLLANGGGVTAQHAPLQPMVPNEIIPGPRNFIGIGPMGQTSKPGWELHMPAAPD